MYITVLFATVVAVVLWRTRVGRSSLPHFPQQVAELGHQRPILVGRRADGGDTRILLYVLCKTLPYLADPWSLGGRLLRLVDGIQPEGRGDGVSEGVRVPLPDFSAHLGVGQPSGERPARRDLKGVPGPGRVGLSHHGQHGVGVVPAALGGLCRRCSKDASATRARSAGAYLSLSRA